MKWFEQARAAEEREDWDTAVLLTAGHARCYGDSEEHDSHLWHMDLLVRAQRFAELTERALTDVHARRRLNRGLRDQGREAALRHRAAGGDVDALYVLLRLLCGTGRSEEAGQVLQEVAPENPYAQGIVADGRE
ncbi:hypothetical protein ACIRJR_10580 [Streptomyces sp. NPDC102402]|uniref:hypothetical protein n=1 Tax=Streptomyces sp. NPDC102402 TaxID=3366169 RepID=UPI0038028075